MHMTKSVKIFRKVFLKNPRLIRLMSVKQSSSTINEKDVKFHETLIHDWWDPNGSSKGLHAMNQIRVPFVRDGIIASGIIPKDLQNSSTPLKNIKILDVGCGGGILSEALARIGAEVTGVDAGAQLIDLAVEHAKGQKFLKTPNYVCTPIEDFAKDNNDVYDAVVLSEIIEHVDNKPLFLKSCVESMKPSGSLFVTTFNRTNVSWFGGIILVEYVFGIIPKGTHSWDNFISPEQLQVLLEDYGCTTRMVQGNMYNPFINKWKFSSNNKFHYSLHAIKH